MRALCLIFGLGTLLFSWTAEAQADLSGAREEKGDLERALGEPLTEEYQLFLHERGFSTSFLDFYHDRLMQKRKRGIILTAVVVPSIAVVTGGLMLIPLLTDRGIGAGIGAGIIGFSGALLATAFLISGAVTLGIANSRLKRISHLMGKKKEVSWKVGIGPTSVQLEF